MELITNKKRIKEIRKENLLGQLYAKNKKEYDNIYYETINGIHCHAGYIQHKRYVNETILQVERDLKKAARELNKTVKQKTLYTKYDIGEYNKITGKFKSASHFYIEQFEREAKKIQLPIYIEKFLKFYDEFFKPEFSKQEIIESLAAISKPSYKDSWNKERYYYIEEHDYIQFLKDTLKTVKNHETGEYMELLPIEEIQIFPRFFSSMFRQFSKDTILKNLTTKKQKGKTQMKKKQPVKNRFKIQASKPVLITDMIPDKKPEKKKAVETEKPKPAASDELKKNVVGILKNVSLETTQQKILNQLNKLLPANKGKIDFKEFFKSFFPDCNMIDTSNRDLFVTPKMAVAYYQNYNYSELNFKQFDFEMSVGE